MVLPHWEVGTVKDEWLVYGEAIKSMFMILSVRNDAAIFLVQESAMVLSMRKSDLCLVWHCVFGYLITYMTQLLGDMTVT